METIGKIRVSCASEYEREGFCVEQYMYVNYKDEPTWAVPGWVEDSWGESGFFNTKEAAENFLKMVMG